MEVEPVASSTSIDWPALAFLRECPARQDAEFAVVNEGFLARENRVLDLKTSFVTSISNESTLRCHVSALRTDQNAVHADLTVSKLSAATVTSKLDQLRADNSRFTSQILNLPSMADSLRTQLSNQQASILCTAPLSLCSKRNRYLGLLRSLVDQIDRIEREFLTPVTQKVALFVVVLFYILRGSVLL